MNNFYKIAAILCMVLGAGRGEEVAPTQQARLGLIQHLPMPLSHSPPAPTHELSIGASPAVKGDFPFIVSLQVGNFHFCGGSIISHHTVLSAAHCMHDDVVHKYMEAVGGDYDLKINEGTEQRRAVARFTIHPKYTRIGITRNDVAVLFLKEPFVFNDYVKPIKLAHPGAVSKGTFILSGWGVTDEVLNTFPDVLMREELPVVDHSVCADRMETPSLPDSILCTGPLAGGMGPCVVTLRRRLSCRAFQATAFQATYHGLLQHYNPEEENAGRNVGNVAFEAASPKQPDYDCGQGSLRYHLHIG